MTEGNQRKNLRDRGQRELEQRPRRRARADLRPAQTSDPRVRLVQCVGALVPRQAAGRVGNATSRGQRVTTGAVPVHELLRFQGALHRALQSADARREIRDHPAQQRQLHQSVPAAGVRRAAASAQPQRAE